MRLSSLNSKKELGLTSERIFFGFLARGGQAPALRKRGYGSRSGDLELQRGQALAHANVRGGQAPALRYRVAVFFNRENRVNLANHEQDFQDFQDFQD